MSKSDVVNKLLADGWTVYELASHIGARRGQVRRWRDTAQQLPPGRLQQLRSLLEGNRTYYRVQRVGSFWRVDSLHGSASAARSKGVGQLVRIVSVEGAPWMENERLTDDELEAAEAVWHERGVA